MSVIRNSRAGLRPAQAQRPFNGASYRLALPRSLAPFVAFVTLPALAALVSP